MWWNYLSLPKLQRSSRWSLRMDIYPYRGPGGHATPLGSIKTYVNGADDPSGPRVAHSVPLPTVWTGNYYSDVTWAPSRLKSPALRLFVQQLIQVNSKKFKAPTLSVARVTHLASVPHAGPVGPVNAKSVSVSWRHCKHHKGPVMQIASMLWRHCEYAVIY